MMHFVIDIFLKEVILTVYKPCILVCIIKHKCTCYGIADRQKIHTFEMWCWRKMLRISWKEHKTNDHVKSLIGVKYNPMPEDGQEQAAVFWSHCQKR